MMKSGSLSMALIVTLVSTLIPATVSRASDVRKELVEQSVVENVLRRNVLRVGMSTFVPWAMKDKKGDLIGFEIDVARRLAADMGVQVEVVPTKWSGIIPALLTGKFDVIIGGMGIRPERNKKVNFTIPYDYSGMSLVANKKVAAGLDAPEKFNNPDVVLVVRLGATSVEAVEKHMPKAELRKFDDEAQAIQELLNGRAHAFVSNKPTPAFLAAQYPERLFLPFKEAFTQEPIGFAIRKGDVDTLNFFNNWIRIVEAEGWLQERRDYWFGGRDWDKLLK